MPGGPEDFKQVGGVLNTSEGPQPVETNLEATVTGLQDSVLQGLQGAIDALCSAATFWKDGDRKLTDAYIGRARRRITDATQAAGFGKKREAKP